MAASSLPDAMHAARLPHPGAPLALAEEPRPQVGPGEALIRVEAVFVPPLMRGRLSEDPDVPVAPAAGSIPGYNAAGTVAEVGPHVSRRLTPGTPVFASPLVAPPGAHHEQAGVPQRAEEAAYLGDFAPHEAGRPLLRAYEGAFAQYQRVPAHTLVALPLRDRAEEATPGAAPPALSFAQAARLGYHGIGYRALRRAGLQGGDTAVVHGATGTVGLGAVVSALALGVQRVIAVARNPEPLRRVEALFPRVTSVSTEALDEVGPAVRSAAGGGADVLLDALPSGAPAQALTPLLLGTLRRGACAALVGGAHGDLELPYATLTQRELKVLGSQWCTAAEAARLARMLSAPGSPVGAETIEEAFRVERYTLADVNEAIERAAEAGDGFTSVVVAPHR